MSQKGGGGASLGGRPRLGGWIRTTKGRGGRWKGREMEREGRWKGRGMEAEGDRRRVGEGVRDELS